MAEIQLVKIEQDSLTERHVVMPCGERVANLFGNVGHVRCNVDFL